ncbi:MAG TPA: YncE family protein [Gemmatimonadaceae bacterium]|jgi:YVTN family beta-propeller protein
MTPTHLLRLRCVLAATLFCVPTLAAQQAPVSSGVVLVANQQSGSATIIDIATREATTVDVGAGPHETVVSPDGKWGVVTVYGTSGAANAGNRIAVIDLPAKRVVRTIDLGTYTRPHGAAFVPGHPTQIVVTSETTSNIVLVDIAEGKVITAIPTQRPVTHMLGITADGKHVFAAAIQYGGIVEIDMEKRAFVRDLQVSSATEGVAVAPDGSSVWIGSNDQGSVSVVDTKSWTLATTITGPSMPYRIGFAPNGNTVVFCDPKANKIWIAGAHTRKITGSIDGLGSPRGVKIAADNRTAYVTLGADNAVASIDLIDRKVNWSVPVGKSPDGVWYGPKP